MSDQGHPGDDVPNEIETTRGGGWFKWILVLLVMAGLGYKVYRIEHEKQAALDAKREARIEASHLRGDLTATEKDRDEKDAYIKKCLATLKTLPTEIASIEREHHENREEHYAAAREFDYLMADADSFPLPSHASAFKDVMPPDYLDVQWGNELFTSVGIWNLNQDTCVLSHAEGPSRTAQVEWWPSIQGLLALGQHILTQVAEETGGVSWWLDSMIEDSYVAEVFFLEGTFLLSLGQMNVEVPVSETETETVSENVGRHMLGLLAPLAADEALVDALGTWAVRLIQSQLLFTGKSGRLAKRYLADLWDASWADFRKLDEMVEAHSDLFSPYCSLDDADSNDHDKTDKREGWWYRRWKAAGGDKKGDALIAKYRGHMITIAEALGMPSFVEKWKAQVDSGKGPPWPKPRPESEEEEQ